MKLREVFNKIESYNEIAEMMGDKDVVEIVDMENGEVLKA